MTASLAVRPRPAPVGRTVIGEIPLVRVRPAPQFEPPYDDEPAQPVKVLGPADRPGPGDRTEPDGGEREPERLWGPAPPGPAGGSPPRAGTGGQAAYRYVGLCLEVLEGFRPATHLRRLTLATAFDTVLDQLARPAARAGHPSSAVPPPGGNAATRPAGRIGGGPGGTAGRPSASPAGRTGGGAGGGTVGTVGRRGGPGADRLRLRRLWVGEPSDGVVEAAAVLGRADRAWALALRLERHEDAWLCTDLQVV